MNEILISSEAQSASYSEEVKSAFLQEALDRGGLSTSDVSDGEFHQWLTVRLRPLLVNLTSGLVTPLFHIGTKRSCNSTQEMITVLDTLHTTLSSDTQKEIYKNILLFLQGLPLLRCYSGGSFYIYLKNTFFSFGFPGVSTFLSLLPSTHKTELLNTISTSELGMFLRQPNVVESPSDICTIFSNYDNTAAFLESEDVPDHLKMLILPCVWHLALDSEKGAEVNAWFDLRLKNYLRFLNKSLISFTSVQNATCLSFQKLVFYMGNSFIYDNSEIGREDVYATIRSYLRAGSGVKCYNSSDADLNSTAWFANYIGNFVNFITLNDLTAFVSVSQISVFLENKANLELFSSTSIPENVTNYYILQLFAFNPGFNPTKLPGALLCSSSIPSSAYSSLNEADTITVLEKLKEHCNGTQDPEVSAALASNIKVITYQTFVNLGEASSGLTINQINSVSPSVLISSLSTLSSVSSWRYDQAVTIIQRMISSGFQVNSATSLESLGTLVAGLPSASIEEIPASELLKASKNTNFISSIEMSPTILRQMLVKKIISVDPVPSPVNMVLNVPDTFATEIPPSMLTFSEKDVNINILNKKTWTSDQAAMFFGNLANVNFDIEELSPFVLQGFTCTAAQNMPKKRIQQLIHACRDRRGRAKVQLKGSQVTCMYNLLNGDLSQNFTDYPPEMLLYFNSKDVQKTNCRSYYSALSAADFSVLGKKPQLFSEARACLGINGLSLSKDNVEVFGNMTCTLDGSYIENSDPLILEKLKACKDLSDSQVAAMEKLLLSGKTQYGDVTTWNQQTLDDLGILPLYFTKTIWRQFRTATKRGFLKGFMPSLRKTKTNKGKLKNLFNQISSFVVKRAAGCTAGNITHMTVSDTSFPFGYDQTQFDLCLDVSVLKDDLNSICGKVDDNDFQKIILKKLNQAFPSGIPDQELQMLGSVSRVASLDDISKWNITKIDTLAALMKTEDGTWEIPQSKQIITKYLDTSGHSLGSTELSIINSNLCSLNTSTLMTITPESIRNAKLLDVASCSVEQKRVLYKISNTSFSSNRASSDRFYNLIKTYLGGAPLVDVVALSTQNISMDVDTFRSLELDVIKGLTVKNVRDIMGSHLQDLKLFENDILVQTWVNLQPQSDLNTLGLGLTSNRTGSTNGTIILNPGSTAGTPMQASVYIKKCKYNCKSGNRGTTGKRKYNCNCDNHSATRKCKYNCKSGNHSATRKCKYNCKSGNHSATRKCKYNCNSGNHTAKRKCKYNCNSGNHTAKRKCKYNCNSGNHSTKRKCKYNCNSGNHSTTRKRKYNCNCGNHSATRKCKYNCKSGNHSATRKCKYNCKSGNHSATRKCKYNCKSGNHSATRKYKYNCKSGNHSATRKCKYNCKSGNHSATRKCKYNCKSGNHSATRKYKYNCKSGNHSGTRKCKYNCKSGNHSATRKCKYNCKSGNHSATRKYKYNCKSGNHSGTRKYKYNCKSGNHRGTRKYKYNCKSGNHSGTRKYKYNCKSGNHSGTRKYKYNCKSGNHSGTRKCKYNCKSGNHSATRKCKYNCKSGNHSATRKCKYNCKSGNHSATRKCKNNCKSGNHSATRKCKYNCKSGNHSATRKCKYNCKSGNHSATRKCKYNCKSGNHSATRKYKYNCKSGNHSATRKCKYNCKSGNHSATRKCKYNCKSGNHSATRKCKYNCKSGNHSATRCQESNSLVVTVVGLGLEHPFSSPCSDNGESLWA
ncbi:uncharacterized protein FYW49_010804 [Xenentodon cancila]